MNFIMSLILVAFLVSSCGQSLHNTDGNKNMVVVENQRPYIRVDSIVVCYWKNTNANEYIYNYSKGEILITSKYFSFEKHISDKGIMDDFLSYIDDFFISKSEKIEYSKTKSSDPIVTDYSSLKFDVFLKNKQIVKEYVQIGEEEYDIEYNPKFLEFYEFLDSLLKE